MAENENGVHCTRSSSKKRDSVVDSLQLSKKRVALGEVTNLPNVTTESNRKSDHQNHDPKCTLKENNSPISESSQNSDIGNQKPRRSRTMKKKRDQNDKENSSSTESTQKLELMRCSNPSSIYGYLRSLEV